VNVVISDPTTVQQLRQPVRELWLTDSTGNVLGKFVPGDPSGSEPPIAEEELMRLEQQEGGRRLAEILADLEMKYGR